MRATHLLSALLLFVPAVVAQDETGAAPAMPNPKHAEHDALKPFLGTWTCQVKMFEGGQAMEMPATETFESVCGGLWLKSVVDSTFMGQPFQGISLLGWDPKAKHYVNVWADSMAPVAVVAHVTHDQKTRTWTSKLVSGMGPKRSEIVWKDADTIVETAYTDGPDGKEIVAMEIVRKRGGKAAATSTAPASVSSATGAAAPTAAGGASTGAAAAPAADAVVADMTRSLGKWNAVARMSGPDGQQSGEKGTETVSSVCGGKWQWSDYSGTWMGMPFEGHGLVGYDPSTQKVTTFWIDGFSPYVTVLTGAWDDAAKGVASSGRATDPTGEETEMSCMSTWKDGNTRISRFKHATKQGEMAFEIEYTRATPAPGALKKN